MIDDPEKKPFLSDGRVTSAFFNQEPETRLLAAVGPNLDAQGVIRWTRNLAGALHCRWIALYVAGTDKLDTDTESLLARNLDLARELGAESLTTTDEDVVRGLMRVARQWNITQIVAGKPAARRGWSKSRRRDRVATRLLQNSGGLEIHLVGMGGAVASTVWPKGNRHRRARFAQYLVVVDVVALVTAGAFFFTPIVGSHATALVYLLAVVLLALFVDRGPALAAAALSALFWDYFFLPPFFAFQIHSFEDAMLFGMYFVVALALGQLTARIKAQQQEEREREVRSTSLYLLTRELNEARTLEAIVGRAKSQIEAVFGAPATITMNAGRQQSAVAADDARIGSVEDVALVSWVMAQGRQAGLGTDNFPEARCLYVPLTNSAGTIGAVGLRLENPLSLQQRILFDAFSQQIALALDRLRLSELAEKARVLTESERLSKTLLDSMSHELRTPIAAIQSAAGNLLELEGAGLSEFQRQMMEEIGEATERLDRLVGNALELNRLESGAVKPLLNECSPAELVHLCVTETQKRLAPRLVSIQFEQNLPITQMDFVLTQQALTNLLSNAAAHTPPGSPVEVSARVERDRLLLTVADRGPGIDPGVLPRIFDKFVRGPGAFAGGAGLGLSLVKGFVEAQGGTVSALNRPGGGASFTIRLPLHPPAPASSLVPAGGSP